MLKRGVGSPNWNPSPNDFHRRALLAPDFFCEKRFKVDKRAIEKQQIQDILHESDMVECPTDEYLIPSVPHNNNEPPYGVGPDMMFIIYPQKAIYLRKENAPLSFKCVCGADPVHFQSNKGMKFKFNCGECDKEYSIEEYHG